MSTVSALPFLLQPSLSDLHSDEFCPTATLPANELAEMDQAFGYGAPLSDEEIAAEDAYAARQCDEQALVEKYPGLAKLDDARLLNLASQPNHLISDAGEVAATAAILLARRGITFFVPEPVAA